MNIKGTVKAALPIESGTSKAGNSYQKQTFVITTEGQYPKDVAFTLFNDRVSLCPKVGEEVDVHFDLSSREWNNKFYTEASAFRVDRPATTQSAPAPQPAPQAAPQQSNDDIPF